MFTLNGAQHACIQRAQHLSVQRLRYQQRGFKVRTAGRHKHPGFQLHFTADLPPQPILAVLQPAIPRARAQQHQQRKGCNSRQYRRDTHAPQKQKEYYAAC